MMRAKTARTPASAPARAWQRMLSGRRLDLLDPSPLDVEVEDIAHGLARVARWNGQTSGASPFTVAQHSVVVETFCAALQPDWPAKWRLAALLHDAPEYVIGDMISPFKAALGDRYRTIEARLQTAVHLRFGLPPRLPDAVERVIKRADRASAFFEATQIAGFSIDEARRLFGEPTGLAPLNLEIETTETAQAAYIERFEQLFNEHETAD